MKKYFQAKKFIGSSINGTKHRKAIIHLVDFTMAVVIK